MSDETQDLNIEVLSDITTHMKYAKYLPEDNRRENFSQIVTRNKEMHIRKFPQMKDEIESAYQFVYDKKVLPSMRSMQFAGKAIEVNPTRIFNCAYMPVDDWRSFSECMFLLLGGTGVGFSVQNHHVEQLPDIRKPNPDRSTRFLIGDSIEGWADAIKKLMKSYFFGGYTIKFDYSDIRPKGARLITAGGKAPGPQPLIECITKIRGIMDNKMDGDKLEPIEVYDIICHIADAVLAGGIRRAALICLFSADDHEMISAKTGSWWEKNPQRGRANNSVVIIRHKIRKNVFMNLWERIKASGSGEPGIYLSNDKDWGTNPCVEIALRPNQFCNLTEINASNIESQEDFNARAKAATLIGTLQASYTDFHYLRPVWQRNTEKDALIGVSMTGIASMRVFESDIAIAEASQVVKDENIRVAEMIGIKPAARTTCVKPAGTTSLVLGTSSGIHAWHNDFYLRRIRVGKNEAIYTYLSINHPNLLEDDFFRPHDTAIITVPQRAPKGAVTRHETALELLNRVKRISEEWVGTGHLKGENSHNVSATISIKENEWDEVGDWMWTNRATYNGLSILPHDGGTYTQAPFEDCSEKVFRHLSEDLSQIDLGQVVEMTDETDLKGEVACGPAGCEVV